jgi:hypothetical protein
MSIELYHYTNMCPSSHYVSLNFEKIEQFYHDEVGNPLVNGDKLLWTSGQLDLPLVNRIH